MGSRRGVMETRGDLWLTRGFVTLMLFIVKRIFFFPEHNAHLVFHIRELRNRAMASQIRDESYSNFWKILLKPMGRNEERYLNKGSSTFLVLLHLIFLLSPFSMLRFSLTSAQLQKSFSCFNPSGSSSFFIAARLASILADLTFAPDP